MDKPFTTILDRQEARKAEEQAKLDAAYQDGYRRGVEDAAAVCFQQDTLCAAPMHCGCREKIAQAIRALMDTPKEDTDACDADAGTRD